MRKIAAFAVAALAVSAMSVGPAGASIPPVTGTITCSTFTGTLAETPALTNNASVKAIKIKGAGAASSCSGAETGGKAPITAATFKMTGSLPIGSSCGSLVTPTFGPTKIQVKWQGLNPSNKLMTVGVDNTTLASAALDINTLSLVLTTAPLLKGPFTGQTLTLSTPVDGGAANLLTQCATGISSLTFGHDNPGSISTP